MDVIKARSKRANAESLCAMNLMKTLNEDGWRCLVGAVVGGRGCESEEDARGGPKERESDDEYGDGGADRP
jgi:hypothetical protein